MAFTAADVKTLREMTGVGMMDCKKALAASDGDMDKVFKFQSEFMTAHDTAYKASLLKDMPTPPGADGKGGSDSEGVAFAKSLAQQNANTSKASSDAMSAFH